MRILLVDPPFGSIDTGGEKKRFAGVENAIPSLGLAYLAAVAEQEGQQAHSLVNHSVFIGGRP